MSARRTPLLNYGVALAVTVLALGLTMATPLRTGSPFVLLIVATLISTHFGGWRPGVFATLFATAASIYISIPPNGALGRASLDDALRLATFDLIAAFVIVLVSRDLAVRRKAEEDALRLAAATN